VNHLFIGAAVPFAVAALLYLLRRGRASLRMLAATPLAMALGAAWALAPDIPRALRLQGFRHEIAFNPATDMFFGHYTLDRIEEPSSWPAAGLALLAAALMAAAWRELRREEEG
jgi:drug/metabolite transporter (DMT)-like permease